MKRFFRFAGDFIRSFPQMLLFECLFKLIITAVGAPFLALLLRIAMKYAGVGYLSADSVIDFIASPVTWIAAVLTLFVVAFFTIVELSALIACFACHHNKKKITISGMLQTGLSAFVKAFRGTGILSFLGFMIIIPLAQFTVSSGVFFAPVTPMLRSLFITLHSPIYVVAFVFVQLTIIYLFSSRCYSLHFLVLTKNPFSECTKQSRSCLEGKKLRTAISLLLWSIILAMSVLAVTFAISFIIIFCIKGFSSPDAALSSALKVLSYTGKIFYAVSAAVSAPVIISFLTTKFFSDTCQTAEIILPQQSSESRKIHKYAKPITVITITAVSIFLNFSYLQQLYKGNISLNIGIFSPHPQITAHRGFSYAAPENTIYAFQKAIEADADYIELDVQQTKDGQLVVFHDTLLDRTTDGTGTLSDFTYEELSELSCGSWFKKNDIDFSDAKIMLLSEVLELIDNKIMLNIEIKKQGDPENTAIKAAELLMEYDFTDSCYITSFSYQALKAVKKTDPHIKTALISNSAASAVYSQLKYIDALSLNYIFVNQNIISSAHKSGKKVFVWTVNNRQDIEQMIHIGADNIITDRPDIAANAVYSYSSGELVLSLLELIFG